MLTTQQIINLARKQDWWNEFDEKRRISIEKAAHCAIMSRDYETFITGSFLLDSLVWYDRAEKFVKLCKEEENKNSVPEYNLVTSEEVVARFYPNNQRTSSAELLSKADKILKESNIAYDYLKYEPEEKAYVAYKNSVSWVKR